MVWQNKGWTMLTRFFLLSMLAFSLTTCAGPRKHLSSKEAASCRAEGGYESRTAFGYPICQHIFADAGKTCLGKSDCLGRCLSSLDGEGPWPKAGDTATGKCQATEYFPGCHAVVERGKLQDSGICDD